MKTTLTNTNTEGTAAPQPRFINSVLTDFLLIAEQVAEKVFESVSHDRLGSLRLVEIGELLDGPESMLKVVWAAKWHDGHTDTFQYLMPLDNAAENIDAIPVRMQHRLQREVFRKDTILAL